MSEQRYIFKNPHPGGVMGCISPLPEPLEDAANRLDGQTMTLADAGAIISDAIQKLGDSQKYRMTLRSNFVMIQRGSFSDLSERVDMWRLIEYGFEK